MTNGHSANVVKITRAEIIVAEVEPRLRTLNERWNKGGFGGSQKAVKYGCIYSDVGICRGVRENEDSTVWSVER